MQNRTRLVLLGLAVGLFAAYAARAVRLMAAFAGLPDTPGIVLVEGLLADLLGLTPDSLAVLPGVAHIAFGGLIGAVLLLRPAHLFSACMAGLAGELLLLAFLTPVKALPNTVLDPLGALAIAVFWTLLCGAAYLIAKRQRPAPPAVAGTDSYSVHRTALA